MSYTNLRNILTDAKKGGYGVGAFNIVDLITAEAVVRTADVKKSPVIVQTSVKTVKLYGYTPLVAAIKNYAKHVKVPVVLHLDHCKEIDVIKSCIEAGWSSVMIDASSFPLDENVKMTSEVVKMARPHNVTVEGELGAIVGVEDDIYVKEQDAHLANPEQSVEFVRRTGIDVFAPAIGTAHGVYKGEPTIAFDLLENISSQVNAFIALHGGTGLSDEVFRNCIRLGVTKINISTQIKHIFRESLSEFFKNNPSEYEPVKVLSYLRDKTQEVVGVFLEKFGSTEKF